MPSLVDEHTDSTANAAVETQYTHPDGRPNVALLQDRSPAWMRATRSSLALTICLAVLFVFYSYVPLRHTDVWGHLSYGRWMVANRAWPATEPLMPLARGVPFIDTAWLSQLAGYGLFQKFGAAALQFLSALSIVLTAACISGAVLKRSRHLGAALTALALFILGSSWQLWVTRPQLAGLVCFAAVFVLASSSRWPRWKVWAIPLVFVAWANVHGSFIVGLQLLGLLIIGRAFDIYARSKSWKLVFAETGLRRLVIATELSFVAVLLNPYGIAIYPEVFAVSRNANLQSLYEWDPLTLRMQQGKMVAAVIAGLLILHRLTPRRVTFQELCVLAGLALGMFTYTRMIIWWVPVAAYYASLHLAAILKQRRRTPATASPSGGLWTVVLLGVVWIAFAATPFGSQLLHGAPKDPELAARKARRALDQKTPVDITKYLVEHPPQGLVYNSYEWGDYLTWAGPQNIQLFVNSHAHLVPTEVWKDYFLIGEVQLAWEEKLDRYGVNTVVLATNDSETLVRQLEKNAGWELRYRDAQGSVFARK